MIIRSRGDHDRPPELADARQPPQQSDARACVSPGCPGCGRYGCPYSPPTSLEEARKVESLGGSPSCLTWPPRPPILIPSAPLQIPEHHTIDLSGEDNERGDDHSRNPGPWGIL